MLNLTINNKTYTVPESWDEVTLATYTDILNAQLDKYASNILQLVKCVAILSGDPALEAELTSLQYESMQELLEAFSWLVTVPDYSELPTTDKLEIEGSLYTIKKDNSKLTVNEMILVEELLNSEKFDLHYFELAAGMLLRKLDENGKELEPSVDLLLETVLAIRKSGVKLKELYALLAFFLSGAEGSTSSSSASSSLKIQKTNLPQKKSSQTGAKQ